MQVFEGLPWQYVLTNQRLLNRIDSGEHSVFRGSFLIQWIRNFLERRSVISNKEVTIFQDECGDIYPVFHMLFHIYNIQVYTAMSGSKMLNLGGVQVED